MFRPLLRRRTLSLVRAAVCPSAASSSSLPSSVVMVWSRSMAVGAEGAHGGDGGVMDVPLFQRARGAEAQATGEEEEEEEGDFASFAEQLQQHVQEAEEAGFDEDPDYAELRDIVTERFRVLGQEGSAVLKMVAEDAPEDGEEKGEKVGVKVYCNTLRDGGNPATALGSIAGMGNLDMDSLNALTAPPGAVGADGPGPGSDAMAKEFLKRLQAVEKRAKEEGRSPEEIVKEMMHNEEGLIPSADADDAEGDDDDEYGDEDNEITPASTEVYMEVVIKRPRTQIQLDCWFNSESGYRVTNAKMTWPNAPSDPFRPDTTFLENHLDSILDALLHERGVDYEFGHFALRAARIKEFREYTRWLKRLQDFVVVHPEAENGAL